MRIDSRRNRKPKEHYRSVISILKFSHEENILALDELTSAFDQTFKDNSKGHKLSQMTTAMTTTKRIILSHFVRLRHYQSFKDTTREENYKPILLKNVDTYILNEISEN